jgi:hypothetical protein
LKPVIDIAKKYYDGKILKLRKEKLTNISFTSFFSELICEFFALEKHLAVHRPAGALDFFRQQTEQYQKELRAAEQQLKDFSRKQGVVSIEIERDRLLLRCGMRRIERLLGDRASRGGIHHLLGLLEPFDTFIKLECGQSVVLVVSQRIEDGTLIAMICCQVEYVVKIIPQTLKYLIASD